MSPALTPLVSALERAAVLIEKGVSPAKALRQVAHELEEHADMNSRAPIPPYRFTHLLGAPRPL